MIKLNVNSQVIVQDIADILLADAPWESFEGKTVVVTGAAGMLAAYIVETLLSLKCTKVLALVRNVMRAQVRFARWLRDSRLEIVEYDCKSPLQLKDSFDYIVHAASIPRPDTKVPVDVLTPNLVGTYYLLEAAKQQPSFKQFIYFSSGAVYGEMRGDRRILEDDGESLSPTKVDNCYSIAKLSGEALCIAYGRQYGIATKMLRYAHTFGPGMDIEHDVRAFAEFFRNAIQGKDIHLQTSGTQKRSYCYLSDATRAFFHIVFWGRPGEAYNIVNERESHSILDFAKMVSDVTKGKTIVRLDGVNHVHGYAPQSRVAMMSGIKLIGLGWHPHIPLCLGIERTLSAYDKVDLRDNVDRGS